MSEEIFGFFYIQQRIDETNKILSNKYNKIFDEYLLPILNSYDFFNLNSPEFISEQVSIQIDKLLKNYSEISNIDLSEDLTDNKISGVTSFTKDDNSIITNVSSIKIPDYILDPKLLWEDKLFPKGECIVLASPPGHSKTLLSIEIAKSGNIKNGIYINLDDIVGDQIYRYSVLSEMNDSSFGVFTYENWEHLKKTLESDITDNVTLESLYFVNNKPLKSFIEYRKRRLKELGITIDNKFDNVFVFEIFMEMLSDDVDFVCIDTWKAFQGNSQFNNKEIDRVISACVKKNVTLLVLHHVNKEGDLYGNGNLKEKFHSVYTINELEEKSNEKHKEQTILELHMIKSRNIAKETYKITKNKISTFKASFKISEDSTTEITRIKTSLPKAGELIYGIVKDKFGGEVKRDSLIDYLKSETDLEFTNPESLFKYFPKYKDKNDNPLFIKDDKDSWNTIKIAPDVELIDNNN